MEPSAAPRLPRPWWLAAAGFVLFAAALYLAMSSEYGIIPRVYGPVSQVLGAVGVACHVAALGLSLYAWRRRGGIPGVALLYGALGVLTLLGMWNGKRQQAAWYRANPDAFGSEFVDGAIEVENARGVWRVALAACPGAPAAGRETVGLNGVLDVMGATGAPYMRLHVAERRVECLPAGRAPAP